MLRYPAQLFVGIKTYLRAKGVLGSVVLTLGLMIVLYAVGEGAMSLKTNILDVSLRFDGTVMPIQQVPNWALTGGENTKPYSAYSPWELQPLMDYDIAELQSLNTDANTANAKITYSTVYLGSYTSEHTENVGSHLGVDIRAPEGTPVFAVANGIVDRANAEDKGGFGKYIILEVPNAPVNGDIETIYIAYAHLSQVIVQSGEIIQKGQKIGEVGKTGTASTNHLHFQIDRAIAPFRIYWPFTATEASSAGFSFFDAVNNGLGREKAGKYTTHPMKWVQQNRQGGAISPVPSGTSGTPLPSFPGTERKIHDFDIRVLSELVRAGESIPIEIKAIDTNGNVFESFTDEFSLKTSDLDVEVSSIHFENGIARLSLTPKNSGRLELKARSGVVEETVGITVQNAGEEPLSSKPQETNPETPEVKLPHFDHFQITPEKNELEIGEKVHITITAIDSDGNVQKSYTPDNSIIVTATNGTVSPQALFAQNFSEGTAEIVYTAETVGEGKVSIGNETPLLFSIIAGFAEVTYFGIDIDGKYVLGVPQEATITTLDANKKLSVRSFVGTARLTLSNGEGIVKPNELTSVDFKNGVAKVSVLITSGNSARIKVQAGAILGESSRITQDTSRIFADVEQGSEYAEEIAYLKKLNIASGYPDGTFHPEKTLVRAEVVKLLIEGLHINLKNGQSPFLDVHSTDWFLTYVVTAAEDKIVSGYPDQTFKPANTITQAEFFKVLLEAAGVELPVVRRKPFEDVLRDQWFAPYAMYAKDHNLLDFGEKFEPKKEITRGEVARAIYRLIGN
ncbi:S-layer homology domain-containing protein [Candidatus Peregrinibacteria bacterium]|nr:S-layer homology domain-containing protein [Candidatus Peregrinibacteria bacterium]